MNNLAMLPYGGADYDDAERNYRRALAIDENRIGEQPVTAVLIYCLRGP